MASFASLGLLYFSLCFCVIAFSVTVWFAPPKRVWQGKWSVLSRVQLIHLGISLGLIVNQLLILVDIVLHLIYVYSCQWQYSDQGLVYLSQCTHSFLDIRQELLVDPIMKCALVGFSYSGVLLIYYAKEKYILMKFPTQLLAANTSTRDSTHQTPSWIKRLFILSPMKLRLLCYFGIFFAIWMVLSATLVDHVEGWKTGIKLSQIISTVIFCNHIIASVGWIEIKLTITILDELKLENKVQGQHRGLLGRMSDYAKRVSKQEKIKLFSYVTSILVLGTGGTAWFVWSEVALGDSSLLNYYAAIAQSTGTVLINMILTVLTLLHASLTRLRESAIQQAQRHVVQSVQLTVVSRGLTSSETSSEFHSDFKPWHS